MFLRARVQKGKDTKHLRELLLAAPDINADLFRTVIAPQLAATQGTRTTADGRLMRLCRVDMVEVYDQLPERVLGVLDLACDLRALGHQAGKRVGSAI